MQQYELDGKYNMGVKAELYATSKKESDGENGFTGGCGKLTSTFEMKGGSGTAGNLRE